ncbi:MAG: hypothetical protein ABI446_11095 [Gemmatimonadaceae bacterium]
MTALERLASARATLRAAVGLRALSWAVAIALSLLAIAGTIDWLVGAPRALRVIVAPAAVALAVLAAAFTLYRGRRVRSTAAVALWLEERVPALRYALVSALDAPVSSPTLEREIAAVHWTPVIRRALGDALLPPLLVLAAAATLLFALPAGVRARISEPRAGDALLRASSAPAELRNRLSPLVAELIPPPYTGEKSSTIDEPSSIKALTGGHIVLRGQGSASGISATMAGIAVASLPRDSADTWRLDIVVPAKPAVIELRDRSFARSLIVAPRADSLPVVTLAIPARDTVMRTPKGALTLGANATDDYGLDAGWFEYIVSSGEGETFTFKSGVIHRVDAGNARAIHLRGALDLDSLQLKPGDLVHVRAVARDRNNVTGPGIGVSETRTIRVPRASEYDSIAIEGAPPPDVDSSQLSQRMLIILAEKLQARRAKLPRAQVIKESQAIGSDEARLRQHVGEIVFSRLGAQQGTEDAGSNSAGSAHMTPDQLLAAANAATQASAGATDFGGDETPVVAVNRPLLEAYNAMWDASRSLEVGEPGAALPPMRLALAAIQRARNAERIYLRGKSPVVIVDVNKVRLAGKRDDAKSSSRFPRAALDSSSERRASRFDAAINVLSTNPSAAIDSLLALRVDALEAAPQLSAALAPAIDALRAHRDATDALVRARRIVTGATVERIDSQWGTAW